MSSSTTGSTRRASSSKTASATRSASSQSSLSLTRSSSASVTSLIPTAVSSQTAAITQSVPVASSTAVANGAPKSSTPVAAIAVVVVILVLGLISSGVAFFLCKRKKRKQRSAEEQHVASYEPKRQNSFPQLDTADPFARDSKASDDDFKSTIYSLDSTLDLAARAKTRSSRASSSIFVADDTMTVTSRSHFLRPVSLGEPIALRGVQVACGQMPPLPESPLLKTSIEIPVVPKATSDRSSVSSKDGDDSKSTHIVTIIRSASPEPVPPVPPVPAHLPPLAPIPPFRYSLFDDSARRDSTNTLEPPRYDSPRPQSMASVYSTPEADDASEMLSPDLQQVLSRLKKRISTPWSINSVETSRTGRMSVARESVEA
ncbi:hypothetical protein FRC10_011654 [Ceratobasidium sp. 414]|nr:hypothetical protein FRC10_011654 [Ceratobasidium sp. 414]